MIVSCWYGAFALDWRFEALTLGDCIARICVDDSWPEEKQEWVLVELVFSALKSRSGVPWVWGPM